MVRLHHVPLGNLPIELSEGRIGPEDLSNLIFASLGDAIADHLHEDGLNVVSPQTGKQLLRGLDGPCRRGVDVELPFVSVVIPTRNRARQLAICLESLRNSDYSDFEVIVVDNGPSDSQTAQLIAKLSNDERVRYVCEPQRGAAVARNRGLYEARGRIVAFTDDDVVVDRYCLRRLAEAFTSAPDVACATGLVVPRELETPAQLWLEEFLGYSKGFQRTVFDLRSNRAPGSLYPYQVGLFGTGANMAFDAETLRVLGGFDVRLGPATPTRGAEDLDAFLRVLNAGHALVYEPAAIVQHQHHRDAATLRRTIHAYGIGLTALLTKYVLQRETRWDIVKRIPRGFRFVFGSSKDHAAADPRGKSYPRTLSALHLTGMLRGPFAYLHSRQAVHRASAGVAEEEDLLVRNGYALIGNSVVTSLLGVVYWILAARHYSPQEIGKGAAAVSSLLLISGIAQLNMAFALPRFIPRAGRSSDQLIRRAYGIAALASLFIGAGFVAIFNGRSSVRGFLGSGSVIAIWYIAAVILWTIFALEDAALTGLRRATWIPVENGLFGVLKLVLLVAFASQSKRFGIFASWTLPLLFCVVPVNFLIFRRLIPRHSDKTNSDREIYSMGDIGRFVAWDYVGGLFLIASTTLMPLIVLSRVGAPANGYFYVTWVIGTSLALIPTGLGLSLTVEAANRPDRMREFIQVIVRRTAAILVPIVILIDVFPRTILEPFGHSYSLAATTSLRLLAAAVIPRSVYSIYISVARVERKTRRIAAVQAALCVLILTFSTLLAGPFGMNGVALGYLIANVVIGIVLLPDLLRRLHARSLPQQDVVLNQATTG